MEPGSPSLLHANQRAPLYLRRQFRGGGGGGLWGADGGAAVTSCSRGRRRRPQGGTSPSLLFRLSGVFLHEWLTCSKRGSRGVEETTGRTVQSC